MYGIGRRAIATALAGLVALAMLPTPARASASDDGYTLLECTTKGNHRMQLRRQGTQLHFRINSTQGLPLLQLQLPRAKAAFIHWSSQDGYTFQALKLPVDGKHYVVYYRRRNHVVSAVFDAGVIIFTPGNWQTGIRCDPAHTQVDF